MDHEQIEFLLLDPGTFFKKYLVYEISQNSSVDCLTWDSKDQFEQSDLPLLSTATNSQVLLNLLPLITDSSKFFKESVLRNSGRALKHGLIGTNKLLVHLIPFSSSSTALSYSKELFSLNSDKELSLHNPIGLELTQQTEKQGPVNILCLSITNLIDPKETNPITSFLGECLRIKKPKISSCDSFYPLSCRLCAKLILRATKMCYWNPSLSGFYELGPNGTPEFIEVLRFALESAKRIRPDLNWAKNFDLKKSSDNPLIKKPDFFAFQDSFEIILPDWKDCVLETVSGYVSSIP